jgi:hypothetical protein
MICPLNLNPMQTKVRQFVPSEYGCDVEHAEQMLVPARSNLGISYTIISGNWIQGFLLPWAGETLKQIKRPSGNQSNHPIGEGNNAKEDQKHATFDLCRVLVPTKFSTCRGAQDTVWPRNQRCMTRPQAISWRWTGGNGAVPGPEAH